MTPATNIADKKAQVKHVIRAVQRQLVDILADCNPSLAAVLIRDLWPDHGAVSHSVSGEIQFRQQQGEDQHG